MPKRRKDGTFHNLRQHKWREVRDLYNKLYKEFQRDLVLAFFESQYFINEAYINYLLRKVDNKPVEKGSIIYQAAMQPGFDLRPYIQNHNHEN